MALPDPVTVAANAPTPALVFAKTRMDGYGSEAVDTGGNGYATLINHQPSKNGNRHYLKLVQTKNATDPYSGLVKAQSASVSMSISRPSFGFTDTECIDLVEAFRDWLFDTEVTPAKILQLQS
jgi:hypothetical protein